MDCGRWFKALMGSLLKGRARWFARRQDEIGPSSPEAHRREIQRLEAESVKGCGPPSGSSRPPFKRATLFWIGFRQKGASLSPRSTGGLKTLGGFGKSA